MSLRGSAAGGRGVGLARAFAVLGLGASLACGGLLGIETLSSLPPDFPVSAAGEAVWISQICVDREGTRGRQIDASYQFDSTPDRALADWGAELDGSGWKSVSIETHQRGDEFLDMSLTGTVVQLTWWRPGC